MNNLIFYICLYGITGCILTVFLLLTWYPIFNTSNWRAAFKETMASVWLWPYVLWVLLVIFWAWLWRKKQKHHRWPYHLVLLLILSSWVRISSVPSKDYPGFYRVKFKNSAGIIRSVITDDSLLQGGAL